MDVYSSNNGDFKSNGLKTKSKLTSSDLKKKHHRNYVTNGINQTRNKTYKRNIVIIYSPNSGDFIRFQSKLTNNYIGNDFK